MELVTVKIKTESKMAERLGNEVQVPVFEDDEVGIVTDYMSIGALNDSIRRRWTTVANPADHGTRGGGRKKSLTAEQSKAVGILEKLMSMPEATRKQIAELLGVQL